MDLKFSDITTAITSAYVVSPSSSSTRGPKMYCPTALSAREDQTLRKYAAGRRVSEAGALLGHSTIQLAQTARGVVSIDRHTGYDKLPNNTLRSFLRNLAVSGVAGRVLAVVGDASRLADYPADFVFIDLCGTHEGTLTALRCSQAPLVAVHDFQRQNCPGVGTAVEASGYRVVERVDSLIVLEKQVRSALAQNSHSWMQVLDSIGACSPCQGDALPLS